MTEPALDPEAAPRDETAPVRDESVPPRAPSPEPPRAPASVSNRERAITFWIAAGCVVGALFLGRAWGAHDAQGPAQSASSDAEPTAPAVPRPTDPMTLGLDALYTRRDPVAAAARFREVLLGNPEHYGATFQLATALDQAGDTRSARPLWEKMITMAQAAGDPKSEGIARARVAAIDAALAPAQPADPDAEAMRMGMDALYSKHDPELAAALFRAVLARAPAHYGATFQLATALDQLKKPTEARPLWEKVLKMADAVPDPKTASAARARLAQKP